jgi:DNA-binding NarL/FixJ family response regulator
VAETRIVVADDHPVFRRGLKSVIEEEPGFTVVGKAENGDMALQVVEETSPHVLVLDVEMPVKDGIETAREMQVRFPDVKVTFLTLHRDHQILSALETLNVKGYVLKDSALAEIIDCIKTMMSGETYVSPAIFEISLSGTDPRIFQKLTSAEMAILRCVADEMTSKDIAETLFVSVRTVENHRYNIAAKLELSGTNSLLKYALANRQFILTNAK